MGEWPEKTLGDLVTLQRGIDLPATKRAEGEVPIMGSFGVTGYHDEAAMLGPGVTVGRSGASIGVVSYIERDYWPLNTCLYVKDFHGNNPRFAYYLISTLDLAHYNSGSAQPSLNRNYIHPIPLAFPSREEQDQIVELLGALDDMIELNRRMKETLEAIARALFKDWFVDFGPTRAKMDGREPYLAPELWDLFPDRVDDEDKPVGWSVVHLTGFAEINPESWSRSNSPEEVEYVDLANTKWGTIEAAQRFSWQDAPSRAKHVLRPGDTIVGMVRPGNGSYAFISDFGLTGSTGFAVLRPRQLRYTELLYLGATAPENIQRLANLADGAAYPAVRPGVVGATEVVFSDDAIVIGFSALVATILGRIESNKRENHTLARTRDLLLPKLMSGEIRLGEAEKAMEAVA